MFKRKPRIQVLKVQHEVRDVQETLSSSYNTSLAGSKSTSETKDTKKVNFTVVLLVKNGELYTREFNGKWDLADVKQWESI